MSLLALRRTPSLLPLCLVLSLALAACAQPVRVGPVSMSPAPEGTPTPGVTASAAPAVGVSASPAASVTPAPSPAAFDPNHNSRVAEKAACALLDAPGMPVTVTAERPDAPLLVPNRRYDLTIGAEGGYATLTVPREAEWSLFTDADVLVFVRLRGGQVVFDLEEPGASAVCPAIARQRVFALEPAVTYMLEFDAYEGRPLGLVFGETHPDSAASPSP